MKNKGLPYLFLRLVILLVSQCSTEKNTIVTRTYHNITSHYNILFNARQAMLKGETKIEESYEEDYTQLLPVFRYAEMEDAGSVKPDMNRVIEKCTKVIELHSLTVKPKRTDGIFERDKSFYKKNEYNKWIDESYFLIGKANFYLKEYAKASKAFNRVINLYKQSSSRMNSLLWLSRVNIAQGDYGEAAHILQQMQNKEEIPESMLDEYYASYAHYHIVQEEYEQAIPYLEKTIEHSSKKNKEARYNYILAQLHRRAGEYQLAAESYEQVVRKNPPYEMVFNAQVQRASLMDVGSGKSEEVKKELRKMLKDDKNIEYQDRIYFALAQIAEKEGNIDQAVEYYTLSAQKNMGNTNQRVMSFLALADLFFQRKDYAKAQAYYDSTASFITDDYPNSQEILRNTRNLNNLVSNLNVINREDSLQRLAKMDKATRDKLIAGFIKEHKEKQRQKELERQEQLQNRRFSQNNQRFQTNQSASGKWYFYNPSALSYGQSEVQQKWGRRKLTDNWRRKNKQNSEEMQIEQVEEEEQKEETPSQQNNYSKTDPRYYTEAIPETEEEIEKSNEQIARALYQAGKIYHEDLDNPEKAVEMFKELIRRFPDYDKVLPAMYDLYSLNRELNNASQAENYKQRIIRDYPESNYARVLKNPNYGQELEAEKNQREIFYSQTFDFYQNGNYDKVKENCQYALNNYQESDLIPRFAYLNALATGKLSGRQAYRKELNQIMEKYPETGVSQKAEETLAMLEKIELERATADDSEQQEGRKQAEEEQEEEQLASEELYQLDTSETHYFVVLAKNSVDYNQLKFNLTNFHIDNYKLDQFTIEKEQFNENFQNVVVKSFESAQPTIKYYQQIEADEKVFDDFKKGEYRFFIISECNYKTLMSERSVGIYLQFFNQHYQ